MWPMKVSLPHPYLNGKINVTSDEDFHLFQLYMVPEIAFFGGYSQRSVEQLSVVRNCVHDRSDITRSCRGEVRPALRSCFSRLRHRINSQYICRIIRYEQRNQRY